jgi:1A family penicillin-binding protein
MQPAYWLLRKLATLFYLMVTFSGIVAVFLAFLFFYSIKDLPRLPEPLSRIIETPPTEIFAADGQTVLVLGGREYVPLNRVSLNFIQAILATEDHRFWDHPGINKLRTLKAMGLNLLGWGRVQGASTITQQLAKNLFFSFEKTYTRKFRELLIALQIEAQFSKQEIIEAYINQITFGVNAVGIEPASRLFFGKPAAELTLAEAAFLAGLPKSPTFYSPYSYFDRAKARQRVVLDRMVATHVISAKEAKAAAKETLKIIPRKAGRRSGSYFLDVVLKELEKRYGTDVLYHGGLKITTTIDPQMQTWAEEAVNHGIVNLEKDMDLGAAKRSDENSDAKKIEKLQGALVAVETRSGAVKAVVGGRNYLETQYNRAVQHNRQPGSNFKPFLYYSAFEKEGLSPASVVEDKSVTIPVKGAADWVPKNFEREYQGPIILKKALSESINTVAAQLVALTGPEAVIEVARRCGIKSPLKPVYSVALGTSGVSPLEMASAFATFATGGIQHDPFFIWRVEDAYGRILEEHIVNSRSALDPEITYQIVDMMQEVVDHGSGKSIRHLGFELPAAGKTGTSNGYRDAWFTGFTPTLSTSIWLGFDKNKGLRDKRGWGITGGRGAAPIWGEFMKKATAGEPPRAFLQPDGIKFVNVNPKTGKAAYFFSSNRIKVALRQGQKLDD